MSCPAARASGPFWPPAGHPSVDQLRIACEALRRPESETFHDTGSHPFDQTIRAIHQSQHRLDRTWVLEIQRQRAFTTIDDGLVAQIERVTGFDRAALDQDDLSPHIGQQHAAERRRPDAGNFDNAYALKNTHACHP
jgi:hypothetical protein